MRPKNALWRDTVAILQSVSLHLYVGRILSVLGPPHSVRIRCDRSILPITVRGSLIVQTHRARQARSWA